jgi:hypothetical protein
MSVTAAPKFVRIWVLIYLRMISWLLHSVTFPCSCTPLWKTQKLCKIAELAFCHITIYGNALDFDADTLCGKALPRSPYMVMVFVCFSIIAFRIYTNYTLDSRLIQLLIFAYSTLIQRSIRRLNYQRRISDFCNYWFTSNFELQDNS